MAEARDRLTADDLMQLDLYPINCPGSEGYLSLVARCRA